MLVSLEEASSCFDRNFSHFPFSLHPQFLKCGSMFHDDDANPLFWLHVDENNYLIYSFLKCSIQKSYLSSNIYFDIQPPYGYGCPISNSEDIKFLKQAKLCFQEWASDNHIVAEFIRYHPLVFSEKLNNWSRIHSNRDTVSISLGKTIDLKSNLRRRFRSYINKSQKNYKLIVNKSSRMNSKDVEEFIDLYYRHMEFIEAKKGYFFNHEYLISYCKSNPCTLFSLKNSSDSNLSAAALIIENGKNIAEYFLGCEQIPRTGDNVMLIMLYMIAKYYQNLEYDQFYLGGGRSVENEDSLLRFKLGLSKDIYPYFIGSNIYDQNIYSKLKEKETINDNNRVLFYRDNL